MNDSDVMTTSPGRRETSASLPLGDEFVVIGSTGNCRAEVGCDMDDIRALRSTAERLLRTCNQLTSSSARTPSTNSKSPQTAEQATQTEDTTSNRYDGLATRECCARFVTDMEQLKLKLKEVVDMNVRWQLLHDEREKHIADLERQINGLRQQQTKTKTVSPSITPAPTSTNSPIPNDSQTAESGTGNSSSCSSRQTLNENAYTWECNYIDRSQFDGKELEAQNRTLLESLESARISTHQTVDQLTSTMKEQQALVETLQAQVVVYREDFEIERLDRQRAQSRLVELEAELQELKKTSTCRQNASLCRVPSVAIGRRPVVPVIHAGSSTSWRNSSPAEVRRASITASGVSHRQSMPGTRQARSYDFESRNMGYYDDVETDVFRSTTM